MGGGIPGLSAGETSGHATEAELLQSAPRHVRDMLQGAESFPGPLSASIGSGKLKSLADYLRSREDQCPDQDERALWGLLRLLVAHKGVLRPGAPQQDGADGTLGQQLARVLCPSGPAQQPVLLQQTAAAASDPESAAQEVQRLLLGGQRLEAARAAARGRLWGMGLLIARQCSPATFTEIAALAVQDSVPAGSPLHLAGLMMAGVQDLGYRPPPPTATAGPEPPAAAGGPASRLGFSTVKSLFSRTSPKEDGEGTEAEVTGPFGALPTAAGTFPGGFAMPLAAAASAGMPVEERWREALCMLASNSGASGSSSAAAAVGGSDSALIRQLGERLADRGQVVGAHACYVLSGGLLLPDCFSSGARLCLLGGDHVRHPRTFASVDSIQRTEVLEWALHQQLAAPGTPPQQAQQLQGSILAVQPFKLHLACLLAELGHGQLAVRYCEASSEQMAHDSLDAGLDACGLPTALG